MITSTNILTLVSNYIKTKDLGAFSASFAEVFYDIEKSGDPSAIQLSYEIESLLAAVTGGVCSEAAFYSAMKATSPSVVLYDLTLATNSEGIMLFDGSSFTKLVGAVGTGKPGLVGILPSAGFGSTIALPDKGQTNTSPLPSQQVIAAI